MANLQVVFKKYLINLTEHEVASQSLFKHLLIKLKRTCSLAKLHCIPYHTPTFSVGTSEL